MDHTSPEHIGMDLKHLSQSLHTAKSKFAVALGVTLFVLAQSLLTDLSAVLSANNVYATVTDRSTECRVAIYNADKKWTRRTMACDAAYALKRADERRWTKVYRRSYVTLSFTLRSGKQHTVRVSDRKVRARNVPVSGQVKIYYSPRNPNRVRAAKSWGPVIKSAFWVVAVGLGLLFVLFGKSAFFTFFRKQKARLEQHVDRQWVDDLVAQVEKSFDQDTARKADAPARPSTAKPTRNKPARKRTKPAPIPTTGGVVSRRRSWFGFAG